MNNTMGKVLLAVLALCGLAAAQDVTYNFDQSVDFSKYKTYKWVEIKDSVHPDQLIDK
jgi:hypothetical protein